MFRKSWVLLFAAVFAAGPASAEIHRFKPTKGWQTYAVREPALTVNPGDRIESNTLFSDFYTEKDGLFPGEVGPIFIKGAAPGDTLVIKILKIRPNVPTGRSGTSPAYGVLTATEATPMLHEPVPARKYIWKIDAGRMVATLELPKSRMKEIRVNLQPMLGRLATAPRGDQAISSGVPSDFGGNMDTTEAREGATIYLPDPPRRARQMARD